MLSLNSIISGGLEAHYLKHFNLKLENFSGSICSRYTNKDSSLMIPMILLFYLKKEKKLQVLGKILFRKTSGLGHSMHSDELYKKSSVFYSVI
jgi:hypothetical protein